MKSTCTYCEEQSETTCPQPMCRTHAIEFFEGVVAIGAATSRVHREAPGNVDVCETPCTDTIFVPRDRSTVSVAVVELVTCKKCLRQFERIANGRKRLVCRSCLHDVYREAQKKGVASRMFNSRIMV